MPRRGQSQEGEAPRRTRPTRRTARVSFSVASFLSRSTATHVEMVVDAVNRIGGAAGASLADITRVALESDDLPEGWRSVLRTSLRRAVEQGRLERLPGGIYRVPAVDVADDDRTHHENLGVQTQAAVENSIKKSNFASTCTTPVECEVKNIQTDVVGEFIPQHLLQLYFPLQPSPPVHSARQDAFFQHLIFDGMDGNIFGNDVEGGVGGDAGGSTAGDHARGASSGLFKLSSDIITTIMHTALTRLNVIGGHDGGGDVMGGGGVSGPVAGVEMSQVGNPRPSTSSAAWLVPDADPVADPVAEPDTDPDADPDACPRRGDGRGVGGHGGGGGGRAAETRMVVRTTGTAMAEIARVASEGSRRVLDVAYAESADEAIASVETKDAVFKVFKEAAIDIVRAARTFGKALRTNDGVEGHERPSPRFEPSDSDQGDAYESLY